MRNFRTAFAIIKLRKAYPSCKPTVWRRDSGTADIRALLSFYLTEEWWFTELPTTSPPKQKIKVSISTRNTLTCNINFIEERSPSLSAKAYRDDKLSHHRYLLLAISRSLITNYALRITNLILFESEASPQFLIPHS